MARLSDFPEGSRVTAPNPRKSGEIEAGIILDNLSAMYFIRFDRGTEDFVFKAERVRLLDE
jgi:hypothetical protein